MSTDNYPIIYFCQIHCRGYFFIIHQIFSLARDWSRHVTWPNNPQLCSRKIACSSEQIMSVEKYPIISSCQTEAIVYILVSHGKSQPPDPPTPPNFHNSLHHLSLPISLTPPSPPLLTTLKFFWAPKFLS